MLFLIHSRKYLSLATHFQAGTNLDEQNIKAHDETYHLLSSHNTPVIILELPPDPHKAYLICNHLDRSLYYVLGNPS